ncbi:uncharacterized protein TNCV_302941 [Trichonephila clavipes]|nr:uncharacterized protein TNCV_302941 [Trichonephila clavipes]
MLKKSFVKERKKKTSSKSSQKSDNPHTPRKYCKSIKCYCQISIKVHEIISSTERTTLQNTLLMLSLRDGNAIETRIMTAQINRDLRREHLVPLATEPSKRLVRFETDACKSIIHSILRYKDYDFHKNAHKNLQRRFIGNRSFYDRFWFRDDLRTSVAEHKTIFRNILPEINLEDDTLKHATIADKV